jgi:hypothetical protein
MSRKGRTDMKERGGKKKSRDRVTVNLEKRERTKRLKNEGKEGE